MNEVNRSISHRASQAALCRLGQSLRRKTPEQHAEDCTAFLVPEVEDKADEDKVLRKYYGATFEHELAAWTVDEATWPKKRDLKTFKA